MSLMARQSHRRHARPRRSDGATARGLGWVSIAIGLTELLASRQLDRLLGTGNGQNAGVFRVLGVRELAHGLDLLTHDDPTPGIVARLAGDALDGALLGIAATRTDRPSGVVGAAAMVLPVVVADVVEAVRLGDGAWRS